MDLCQNHINLTPWHYKLEMPISDDKDAIMKGHPLSLCPQALKAMTFSLGEVLG